MFDRIANDFDLHQFDDHACQHLKTYVDPSSQAFFLVNSVSNNIDVFKVVSAPHLSFKSQYYTSIKIGGRGYACSTAKENKMLVGCKDGTLLEVNLRTMKIDREMENDMPIQSITIFREEMLILAHSMPSGYLEARSALQIVKPDDDYGYASIAIANLLDTGDINEILLNPVEEDELIIACQRGLFIAHVKMKLGEDTLKRKKTNAF